ncbi:MAG: translation initiation factor IF-2 subunit beta [Candidatus Micrarchaeia archaeon]
METATNYSSLLDRAFANLPKRSSSGERFECPVADLFVEGNKTTIRNFDFICSRLRREPPAVAKYLFKELAVPGSIAGGKLVLQGKFMPRVVNDRIQTYCQTSVICKQCGKPDTHLEDVDRHVKILVCEACGAKNPVRT